MQMVELLCSVCLILLAVVFCSGGSIQLNGSCSTDSNGLIDYIYQLPPNQTKGVVFIAHGCGDSAGSFWPKTKTCAQCCGLPLGNLLTLYGLQHNYAIVAGASLNRCWKSDDFPQLIQIIHHFYLNHDLLYKLPLHFLGICKSGQTLGLFLQNDTLIQQLLPIRVRSLAVTVSALKFTANITRNHPFLIPTLLIPMQKDGGVMWEINKTVPLIQSYQFRPAYDWPLTKEKIYHYSFGYFNESESSQLYQVFKEHGFLNESDYLRKDPLSHHYRWRQMIRKYARDLYDKDVVHYHVHRDACVLAQLLESAFGYHGYPVEQYSTIFEFFDQVSALT